MTKTDMEKKELSNSVEGQKDLKQDSSLDDKHGQPEESSHNIDKARRSFVVKSATAVACAGAAMAAIPFVKSLGPDAGVLSLGSTEVDISKLKPGETMTTMWRGTPVFIRHRTQAEIDIARETKLDELKDPESDEVRVLSGHSEWLVVTAVCTHLGCVPLSGKGDYEGWLCPCHGSHYDTSGRIRKGPAPKNLAVPEYTFLDDKTIKIG